MKFNTENLTAYYFCMMFHIRKYEISSDDLVTHIEFRANIYLQVLHIYSIFVFSLSSLTAVYINCVLSIDTTCFDATAIL